MSGWALGAADVGPFGVVLVGLAALVGALAIHFLRRRKPAGMPPPSPGPDTSVPPEDAELAARLRETAARMGLPERLLPRAHAPAGDGDFVWREGEAYRYQSIERGGPVADHAHASLAEVFFALFRDRTRMHAYLATIGMEEPAREAEIVKQQRAMLGAGDSGLGGAVGGVMNTITLWRPVGPKELELIEASGWKEFPPRLPEQPIFYPVTTREYAIKIARDWNVPASGSGFVTEFNVLAGFLEVYPVEIAGGREHQEYWIPAEDLPQFNGAIVGTIRVVDRFGETV